MTRTILFVFILTCALQVFSQKTTTVLEEIEITDNYNKHSLYKFGESGIVIQSQKRGESKNEIEYKYEQYDHQLKRIQSKSISLKKELNNIKSVTSSEWLHNVFLSRKGGVSIVSLKAIDFELTTVNATLPKNSWLLEVKTLGDYLHCIVSAKKNHYIYTINWKTGQTVINPIQLEGYPDIKSLGLQILEKSNEIISFYTSNRNINNTVVHAIILNKNGQLLDTINISRGLKKNIVSISASKTKNGKYIFVGSYSLENTDSSDGIFSYAWAKDSTKQFEYHNYVDLNHFTSYFDEFKQRYIVQQKKNKEKNGEAFSLNYQLVHHDLLQLEDGYIFIAEAFFKIYDQNPTTSRPTTSQNTAIVHPNIYYKGNQYTHVIIYKLDESGKIIWNETLEMNPDFNPRSSKKFLSIIDINQNTVEFGFYEQETYLTKVIDFEGQVRSENSVNFSTYAAKAKPWYDQYFISFIEVKGQKKKNGLFKVAKLRY